MRARGLGPAGFALLLLAGCGGGETTPGQPSAEEQQKLDNIAAKQDAELQAEPQTFDTSADSLIPAEGAAGEGNQVAGNEAAQAPDTSVNSSQVNAAGAP